MMQNIFKERNNISVCFSGGITGQEHNSLMAYEAAQKLRQKFKAKATSATSASERQPEEDLIDLTD